MTETMVQDPQNDEQASSRWEDFVDILYAPTAVFERRRGAGFGWMLFGLTVLLAVLVAGSMMVLGPVYQAEMAANMPPGSEGSMDMEQMARFGLIFGVIGFVIVFPISVLFIGLILWGAGKIFGAAMGFAAAALVATYAQVPIIFQQLVAIVQGLVMDVHSMNSIRDVSFSLARFLPDGTSPAVMVMAGRLDLFGLWGLALMTIGVSVLGRLPKGQAFVVAFIAWLVAALPELIGALMAGG